MLKVCNFIFMIAFSLSSFANAGTLDFHCPGHGKTVTVAKCFIEAEKQLQALGCEGEPKKSMPLSCGGGFGAESCGILVLKNCGYAGGSKDGKTYSYGGTQEDCVANYGVDALYVPNENKKPYFPGICVTKGSAPSGTLDFQCAKHKNGMSQSACLKEAEEQLSLLNCQVDKSASPKPSCGGSGERASCGILVLKGCGYAGGSKDGKTYIYGGTQADCVSMYGANAKYVKNETKDPYFPGICQLSSDSVNHPRKAGTSK